MFVPPIPAIKLSENFGTSGASNLSQDTLQDLRDDLEDEVTKRNYQVFLDIINLSDDKRFEKLTEIKRVNLYDYDGECRQIKEPTIFWFSEMYQMYFLSKASVSQAKELLALKDSRGETLFQNLSDDHKRVVLNLVPESQQQQIINPQSQTFSAKLKKLFGRSKEANYVTQYEIQQYQKNKEKAEANINQEFNQFLKSLRERGAR